MGEKVGETLSKLHLRLRTIAHTSRGSTETLIEVTLTGDSPDGFCKFLLRTELQKNEGFILSFFSNETVFSHLFCGVVLVKTVLDSFTSQYICDSRMSRCYESTLLLIPA